MPIPEIRTIDDLLTLLDAGEFRAEVMQDAQQLYLDLQNHQRDLGGKPKGALEIKLTFQLNPSGDLGIIGKHKVTAPARPAASGVAFIGEGGQLTLESPFLTRMSGNVRDPSSGQITPLRDTAKN